MKKKNTYLIVFRRLPAGRTLRRLEIVVLIRGVVSSRVQLRETEAQEIFDVNVDDDTLTVGVGRVFLARARRAAHI